MRSVSRLLWRAAASLDAGLSEATKECAMAKRLATDAGFHVANEALQLHGGYGYLKDFPIERYLRDLRVHQRRRPRRGAGHGHQRADPRRRDRKSTRLNSSHSGESRMPSSA